jgi:glycosyltransferase involved in cell wall biosynthesis
MGKSIVFTVTTDLTHDQRMRRIAGTLAAAGYEVTLLGRQLPSSRPLETLPYRQYRISCFFIKGPFFYLEYNLRLIIWFLSHPFDLYGAVDADTALAGIFTSWWRQKPLVYDAHEFFQELPEVMHRPRVKKIWTFVERLAFKRARLAYTVSASLQEHFQQKYLRSVGLVRNMPLRQTQVGMAQKTPYFIYQGALNVGRGLECTLEAMQQVPAQLYICGDGPLKAHLITLSQELGVEEKVIFKGNVEPAALVSLTASAVGGIMLLENTGLSYYYSLANKFFDYVQAGIPQVCVPFPEYLRLNEQHQVALMTQPEVKEVKEALLTLLKETELYARLRNNCLAARQEWSWQAEGQRLIDLYDKL